MKNDIRQEAHSSKFKFNSKEIHETKYILKNKAQARKDSRYQKHDWQILKFSSKFDSQNVQKLDIWGPQAPKIALGGTYAMLRGSQRLTRGAWGSQTGVTEAAWRRFWTPQGLPRKALGPVWETSRGKFGAKFDSKLDDIAADCLLPLNEDLKLSFTIFGFA